MKRYCIILIILIFSPKVFGLSFPEYPLAIMIDQSEFIVHGYVVDTFKTDSITKSTIRKESHEKQFCWSGYAANIAMIKIISAVKGELQQDTILIPYHSDIYRALPDFKLNDTILLFLNKFNLLNYFGKTDPRFGVKSSHIDMYIKSAKDYQKILEQPDSLQKSMKFNWLVDLACSPDLTWEGTEILKNLPDSIFDNNSREKLSNALVGFKSFEYMDENLIDIVSGFGFNIDLILLCIENLELILKDTDKNYFLSSDLMRAINKMDSRREYKKLIKKYWKYSFDRKDKEKQIEVIKSFVENARLHYAQQGINTHCLPSSQADI